MLSVENKTIMLIVTILSVIILIVMHPFESVVDSFFSVDVIKNSRKTNALAYLVFKLRLHWRRFVAKMCNKLKLTLLSLEE
jgi:hypothetical protein